MNPKWMMTDEERRARMEDRRRRRRRRRRTGEEDGEAMTTVVTPFISHLGRGIFYKTPNTLYTSDEMQQVLALVKLGRNAYFKVLTDLLSRDLRPARIVYEMNVLGRRADPPFIDRLEKLLREAHRSMFATLSEEAAVACPEIGSLDRRDLDVLAEHNFDCYFATMCSHYFCNPDFHNNLRSMCRYMMEERRDALKFHNFEAVLEAFQDFERSGRQLQLDYDKVYDCPSPSLGTHPGPKGRLREILRKLQAWPREAPGQPCDVVCATINVAMRMLSTLGLPPASLRNRAAVERLQEQFVQMLYRYLIFLHDGSAGRAGSRLASGWVGVRVVAGGGVQKHWDIRCRNFSVLITFLLFSYYEKVENNALKPNSLSFFSSE